jgi:hypothetical protein
MKNQLIVLLVSAICFSVGAVEKFEGFGHFLSARQTSAYPAPTTRVALPSQLKCDTAYWEFKPVLQFEGLEFRKSAKPDTKIDFAACQMAGVGVTYCRDVLRDGKYYTTLAGSLSLFFNDKDVAPSVGVGFFDQHLWVMYVYHAGTWTLPSRSAVAINAGTGLFK